MSVKIRLMRVGKKKQPTYRVVVADARSPRDGRFLEILGQYAPRQEPSLVTIDSERALHWLNAGAQPTESAAKLLQIAGVWDAYKDANGKVAASKPKVKSKAKTVKETPAAAAPAAPASPPANVETAPAEAEAAPAPAEDAPAEAATDAPA
ncbi:MAG: small subunit ribosomal protein [Actinomycetota bacterium]|nr:small subunit ribosomal protein [Actinomycetota bacterium]MDQ1475242.1 small subunit ribosomal protein [Actinomycetota bacterium]